MLPLVVALAIAAGPHQLALPAASVVNVDPKVAAFLSEHLAHELKAEGLTVITGREISSLLGMERQRELLGCSTLENSCAANLANALGVEGLVLVSLARLGAQIRTNVDVISARDGRTLSNCAYKSANEDEVADALTTCARHVRGDIAATPVAPAAVTAPGPKTFGWIPLGLGAASAGVGAVLLVMGANNYSTLSSAHSPPLGADDAIAVRDAGKRNNAVGLGLAVTGGVLMVAGGAVLLFAPRGSAVAIAPLPGGAAIAFSGQLP